MRIRFACPTCKSLTSDVELKEGALFPKNVQCKNGHLVPLIWSESFKNEKIWDECPECQAFDVYVQKDVHRNLFLGILMVILFITLILLSYDFILGMGVLLALTIIDVVLYKTLPNVILCYRCHSEARDYSLKQNAKPFDHHIAEHYRLSQASKSS